MSADDTPTFEDTAAVPLAGGVLVSGTSVLLAGRMHPALQFTFLAPQGGSYVPMTVVVGEPDLDELPDVLTNAIASARQAASRTD